MFARYFSGLVFLSSLGSALAQVTPVGNWHTIDEKSGEAKSLLVIAERQRRDLRPHCQTAEQDGRPERQMRQVRTMTARTSR